MFLIFTSCEQADQTVIIDNRYSLDIPSFLKESNDLNEDASLQYQNIWKEFYVIVIDETKDEFHQVLEETELTDLYSSNIIGYSDILIEGIEESMSVHEKSSLDSIKINGMEARTISYSGKTEDIDVYFLFAFIEGKNSYYQVMTWTLGERKDKYKEQMAKIISTFKEL